MSYDEFLRRMPKSSCNATSGNGSARDLADLARKHGVALPIDDVDRLYDYDSIYEF
jgi:adenosine deaminase